MKGKLHKTESGWVVKYYIMRESSHAIHPNEYTLPLIDNGHIDGLMLYDSNEGLEVDFEIVDEIIDLGRHGSTVVEKAKLVKCAQERMYSEEDMRKAYNQGIDDSFDIGFSSKDDDNFNKWFEQFKKK